MTKPLTPSSGAKVEAGDLERKSDLESRDADPAEGGSPDPRSGSAEARSAETIADEGERPGNAVTSLSWLGEAVVTGLVHCACSHQSVHPDLLPLPDGGIPNEDAPLRTAGDDDAG